MTGTITTSSCPLHELVERCEPFGNEIVMRRELVVRQRFPVGEEVDLQLLVEERQLFEQALRVRGVGGQNGERAPRASEPRDRECIG